VGGYIRIDKDKPHDPRMYDAVDSLANAVFVGMRKGGQPGLWESAEDLPEAVTRNVLRNALLGALVTLWAYADSHIREDNTLHVTLEGLAQIVGLPSQWLLSWPEEWLQINEDGNVVLPEYVERNGLIGKDERTANRREQTRIRVQKWRKEQKEKEGSNVTSVTPASQVRTRNARNAHTGTGTGTLYQTGTGVSEKSSETPAQHAALASAHGHLARRLSAPKEAKNGAGPAHSAAELEAFALKAAREGLDSDVIAESLERFGVTAHQVRQWLGNQTPPTKEGSG
jgi:hypothetical protein